MKANRKLLYGILAVTIVSFSFGACREKKANEGEKKELREIQALEGVGGADVVESETIVVEVDSVVADSSKKAPTPPPPPAPKSK